MLAILRQRLWQGRGIWITASGVTGIVLGLRFLGAFQLLEWAALDEFFRLRPSEPVDDRIVVVTIGEAEISQQNWPITDAVMAKFLTKLKRQQPRVIGLDLYRNLPVQPGHADLTQVFESTPNLIGIRKVTAGLDGSMVDPPPALAKRNQVATSDLVLDADGKVRRSLLTLKDKQGKTVVSLGAKLALDYLQPDGITLKATDTSQLQYQLGQATFVPLLPNDGGYVQVDAGGYQILSNFPDLRPGFKKISMNEVMADRIPPGLLRDKLVLIGVTAESLGDHFYTSYSSDLAGASVKTTPGVEIHAALSSQILRSALDDRPLLKVWADPLEWLWIWTWAGVGATLGWALKSLWGTGLGTVLSGLALIGGSYLLFLGGWWIVVVPSLLALVGAAVVSKGYVLWANLRLSYRSLEEYSQTLEHRVEERTLELSQKNIQLQATEAKYRSIFENAVEGIFQITPEGRYISANPALAKIYGYSSPNDLFDLPVSATQQLYVDPNQWTELTRLMQTKGEIIGFESQVYRRDGSMIWISENARAVRDDRDRLIYYEGIVEDITERKQAEAALRAEQEKSERLLLNILPQEIATQLKQEQGAIATRFDQVTVLFSDIVNFTGIAARLSPTELVNLLNEIFSAFDHLAEQYGLEKIKTIGDAYMVVGGLPAPRDDHAEAIAKMALEMQQVISQFSTPDGEQFRLRIGINTGPVVAGVIGIRKFSYDLWGDTVNVASRMESHGMVDKIQVAESTYRLLKTKYFFSSRGSISIKGKGSMMAYFLENRDSRKFDSQSLDGSDSKLDSSQLDIQLGSVTQ